MNAGLAGERSVSPLMCLEFSVLNRLKRTGGSSTYLELKRLTRSRRPFDQHALELALGIRFRQEVIHSGRQAGFTVLVEGIGCHRNDGCSALILGI